MRRPSLLSSLFAMFWISNSDMCSLVAPSTNWQIRQQCASRPFRCKRKFEGPTHGKPPVINSACSLSVNPVQVGKVLPGLCLCKLHRLCLSIRCWIVLVGPERLLDSFWQEDVNRKCNKLIFSCISTVWLNNSSIYVCFVSSVTIRACS